MTRKHRQLVQWGASAALVLAALSAAFFILSKNSEANVRMMVKSAPAGASVYLDDRLLGETPLQLPTLAAGTHELSICKKGYGKLNFTLTAPVNQPVLSCSLKALDMPKSGSIAITTIPAGGEVYVDDRYYGETKVSSDGGDSQELLVQGLDQRDTHTAYFVFAGQKSPMYRFRTREKPLRMLIWRPNTILVTADDEHRLGMVRKKADNGDVFLLTSKRDGAWFKAEDIKAIRPVFPVVFGENRGVKIEEASTPTPLLVVDAFPGGTETD